MTPNRCPHCGSTTCTCASPEPGMSLLDYFAGQVLAGFLAMETAATEIPPPTEIAMRAYDIAAAMIAERSKR